ncbi:478_t:CDS:2, partial [Rhizophagus irregularis]
DYHSPSPRVMIFNSIFGRNVINSWNFPFHFFSERASLNPATQHSNEVSAPRDEMKHSKYDDQNGIKQRIELAKKRRFNKQLHNIHRER